MMPIPAHKVVAVLAVMFSPLAISFGGMGESRQRTPQKIDHPAKKVALMTKQEEARLRAIIYDGPFCTQIQTATPVPQREVALGNEIVELHKKKRVAVVKLLPDITRGGRPKDALAAGVTALALEEGPSYAVLWLDGDLDSFDKGESDDLPTDREKLVNQVEKALAKAQQET
jgi:hypothetical protein